MSKADFTPGPWIPSFHGFQVLTDDERHSICALSDCRGRWANSRLIAAAPEMYEALKTIMSEISFPPEGRHYPDFDGITFSKRSEMWDKAMAAIAKAEGQKEG